VPLYMDIHRNVEGLTAEAVANAHQKDLEVQDEHGVQCLNYWYDEGTGTVFCLFEAPSKEAADAVHRVPTTLPRTKSSRSRKAYNML
jgi:hypothetical protein